MDDPPSSSLLFAYGTLGPGAGPSLGWQGDAVRGRLFDLGPYPILVDWDEPDAGWVEGHVRPVGLFELEGRLDAYEGVDEGLFRRLLTTTRAGRLAWLYVYPHEVPAGAIGPLSRWEGRRAMGPPHPGFPPV